MHARPDEVIEMYTLWQYDPWYMHSLTMCAWKYKPCDNMILDIHSVTVYAWKYKPCGKLCLSEVIEVNLRSVQLHLWRSYKETHWENASLSNSTLGAMANGQWHTVCNARHRFSGPFLKCHNFLRGHLTSHHGVAESQRSSHTAFFTTLLNNSVTVKNLW